MPRLTIPGSQREATSRLHAKAVLWGQCAGSLRKAGPGPGRCPPAGDWVQGSLQRSCPLHPGSGEGTSTGASAVRRPLKGKRCRGDEASFLLQQTVPRSSGSQEATMKGTDPLDQGDTYKMDTSFGHHTPHPRVMGYIWLSPSTNHRPAQPQP